MPETALLAEPERTRSFNMQDLLGPGPSARSGEAEGSGALAGAAVEVPAEELGDGDGAEAEQAPKRGRGRPKKAASAIDSEGLEPGEMKISLPQAMPIPIQGDNDEDEELIKISGRCPGFVTDFAYSLKDTESPRVFNTWAGLFAISVLGARQAHFKWGVGEMIPNLYLLHVANPSICHKGAALGRAARVLEALSGFLHQHEAHFLAQEKSIEMISSKATPDGLLIPMLPKTELFDTPEGLKTMSFGSRAFIWAEEFATFLNARKYNTGLVDVLTYYYDCPRHDKQFTQARGKEEFKDIFLCLAGALTPGHLARSMPEELYTGGFMSRCIVVNVEHPAKWVPLPQIGAHALTEPELVERLAALSWTARGEYDFTPEAKEYYCSWYVEYKTKLMEKIVGTTEFAHARFEHQLIRIATLFRMSEYRPGNDVTLENLLAAKELLEYTIKAQRPVQSSMGTTEEYQHLGTVREYIRKKGRVSRLDLAKRASRNRILVTELNAILVQLRAEGMIEFELDGQPTTREMPSTMTKEIYVWTGDSDGDD